MTYVWNIVVKNVFYVKVYLIYSLQINCFFMSTSLWAWRPVSNTCAVCERECALKSSGLWSFKHNCFNFLLVCLFKMTAEVLDIILQPPLIEQLIILGLNVVSLKASKQHMCCVRERVCLKVIRFVEFQPKIQQTKIAVTKI